MRCGIALYGIAPRAVARRRDRAAAGDGGCKARVSHGEGGARPAEASPTACEHRFGGDTVVATVPVGYADGVPRAPRRRGRRGAHRRPAPPDRRRGHHGPADGRLRRPTPTCAVGDEVVLLGARATSEVTADGVGRAARHHRLRDRVRHRPPRPTRHGRLPGPGASRSPAARALPLPDRSGRRDHRHRRASGSGTGPTRSPRPGARSCSSRRARSPRARSAAARRRPASSPCSTRPASCSRIDAVVLSGRLGVRAGGRRRRDAVLRGAGHRLPDGWPGRCRSSSRSRSSTSRRRRHRCGPDPTRATPRAWPRPTAPSALGPVGAGTGAHRRQVARSRARRARAGSAAPPSRRRRPRGRRARGRERLRRRRPSTTPRRRRSPGPTAEPPFAEHHDRRGRHQRHARQGRLPARRPGRPRRPGPGGRPGPHPADGDALRRRRDRRGRRAASTGATRSPLAAVERGHRRPALPAVAVGARRYARRCHDARGACATRPQACTQCRLARRAAPRSCSAWATRRRPDVRRRGSGRRGGPAGPAVRRPLGPAPRPADARGDGPRPRDRGLHRQHGDVPAAGQPRPAARRDRGLPAVARGRSSTSSTRRSSSRLGQLRHASSLLDTTDGITKLRGRELPVRATACSIPTFHPAAVLAGRRRADGPDAGRPRPGQAGRWPATTPAVIALAPTSVDATRDARRPRSPSWPRPGDLVAAGRRPRRRQDRLRPGLRPRPRRRPSPITSPTFTLARQYEGRLPLHHLDVYRLEQLQRGRSTSAWPSCSTRAASTLIEWGDAIAAGAARRLPRGPPRASATGDDDRAIELRRVGAGWSARGRALGRRAAPTVTAPSEASAVLILGIETATAAGRLRHRRARGRARRRPTRPGAGATPRRSSPAIDFVCRQARVELDEIGVRRRRPRARAVHRPAGRRRHGQGDRPGPAGADDRRVQPRPARLPGAVHATG